jgi:hypothetical protein
MPTKRTRIARPRGAQADAWSEWFSTGFDLAGDLLQFGLDDDDRSPAAVQTFYAEARAAWSEFGAAFLATWVPTAARTTPWAVEQFGLPPGVTR